MCGIVLGRLPGNAEDLARFSESHSHEILQLHHLGLPWMRGGQSIEDLVYGQKLVIRRWARQLNLIEVHPLLPAAMPYGTLTAGSVNEDVPHRLRGSGKEVRAAIPFLDLTAGEPKPGFMHQSRGLKGLTRCSLGHFRGSEFSQFSVDQWKQFLGGLGVALSHRFENLGHVANGPRIA
jgi:hypothetical protein